MENVKLYKGDCFEVMKEILDKSIDMILCDLPYGTTKCKWDNIIPFDKLWEQYNRIIKNNGAIVLFGSQPFTSLLVTSNIKNFRYEIIWEKEQAVNFAFQKKQIGKVHENICVFYKKQPTYNPQMREGFKPQQSGSKMNVLSHSRITSGRNQREGKADRYPISIVKFNRDRLRLHPTCKPIKLLEFLIKTYTNENETVLDNCMGSGSTGIACLNTNRKFIGIEKEEKYFEIAKERIIERL